MNTITLLSALGLLFIFILAEVSYLRFKIYSDRFYSFFHFAGGIISYLFFYGVTNDYKTSFFFVVATGILWEIYEWVEWKYFRKKIIDKPRTKDTIEDLILDVIGAGVMLILLALR